MKGGNIDVIFIRGDQYIGQVGVIVAGAASSSPTDRF